MIFSFDDHHFGMADDNNRSLQERLVARPPGIDRREWYNFAGEMLRVLDHLKAQWQAEAAHVTELEKDAARYRYIKKGGQWIVAATQTGAQVDGGDLDALIDSEMEQN